MTAPEIHALYEVASDAEADLLDRLRRRAGQTWEHIGCWTNVVANARCENCGRLRTELDGRGEIATD